MGGEREDGRVNPENRVSAHNLYVSILEVERLMSSRNPFAITFSDVLAQFCWGQIRFSGDARRGGRDRGGSIIGKRVGGRLHVMRGCGRLNIFQNGRRDSNINYVREILGSEGDGSFDLGKDLSGQSPFLFSPRFLNPRAAPLFFLFPLQPCSMKITKFLVTS